MSYLTDSKDHARSESMTSTLRIFISKECDASSSFAFNFFMTGSSWRNWISMPLHWVTTIVGSVMSRSVGIAQPELFATVARAAETTRSSQACLLYWLTLGLKVSSTQRASSLRFSRLSAVAMELLASIFERPSKDSSAVGISAAAIGQIPTRGNYQRQRW